MATTNQDGRVFALEMLNTEGGYALLAEQYRGVIENIEKNTLSSILKNQNLSGDFEAGNLSAKRFANATSKPYGTAAANGLGTPIELKPIPVPVNVNREIVEPLEKFDAKRLGVPDLIARRTRNHARTMVRELERAFFVCARNFGNIFTTEKSDIEEILEDLIQTVETTQNDFVDGVPRDMIHLVCSTAFYGQIRSLLDDVANSNVDTAAESFVAFHGVKVHSSIYVPAGTNCIAVVEEAIAQPVSSDVYQARPVPLTNRWSLELFYDYGTTAVMPDLIWVYGGTLDEIDLTSVAGTVATNDTIVTSDPEAPADGLKFVYKLGSAKETVVFGSDLSSGWTAFTSGATIAAAANTHITVAAVNANNEAVGVGDVALTKKAAG